MTEILESRTSMWQWPMATANYTKRWKKIQAPVQNCIHVLLELVHCGLLTLVLSSDPYISIGAARPKRSCLGAGW